MFSITNILLLL